MADTSEKDANWLDDDYAMDVIDGSRLFNKDLNLILTQPNHINDNKGTTHYSPDLTKSGSHVMKYSIPSIKPCIDACANVYGITDLSSMIRTCMVHGMSIYEQRYGHELESTLAKLSKLCLSNDTMTVHIYENDCKVRFPTKKTIRVTDLFYDIVEIWGAHTGIDTQVLMGYWILLSLETHSDLENWHKKIHASIEEINNHIECKINLLNREVSRVQSK